MRHRIPGLIGFVKSSMDDFDDLWDDDPEGATITAPFEAPEGGYVHHRFIIGPDGQLYKGAGGDNEFHEDIAAQHGISSSRDPGAHLTGPYALGTAYNHGGLEIHQNNQRLDHGTLQAAISQHFPEYQVPKEGLPMGQDERWPKPRTPAEQAEQLMPDYGQKKQQEQQAVQERGKPYRYYENPFFNRGGKVSSEAQCENCGHIATGPGYQQEVCEACGAPQPYAHQPTPLRSEMEMRNMPAPGEEDMGGNPLQEGFMADGGWQNRMKRDEAFASTKTAWWGQRQQGLPGSLCPNCKSSGTVNADDGYCHNCGYIIPYDGEEILNGHATGPEWAKDQGLPQMGHDDMKAFGPVHQGAAPFNEVEEEYEMDIDAEKEGVAERIAAWDRWTSGRNTIYDPWYVENETQLDEPRADEKLAAQVTKKSGILSLITGAGGGQAGAAAGAAVGAPLGPVGIAAGGLAGRLLGGAVGRALGGGGGQQAPAPAQPALNGPGAGGAQPWESLSSIHAQLVQGGPLGDKAFDDTPSSNSGNTDNDDPEDVDPHEHNDGEHAPETDEGVGSDGFAPEVMHALQLAEPALEHYMQSDESGADDPSIAALVKVLHQYHPELLEMGSDPDPEVDAMFDNHLVKESDPEPSAVGHKTLAYAPGIGGMMPQPGTQVLHDPVAQPAGQVAPQTQGMCPSCGARVTPGQGVCPQCNAAVDPTPDTATAVNPQAPVGPAGQAVPPVMASVHNSIINDRLSSDEPFDSEDYPHGSLENKLNGGKGHCPECAQPLGMLSNGQYHCGRCGYVGGQRMEDRTSANQGPHNPEQMQAVKQYLEDQGRPELVADLIDHPENYGDILAEIQNKQQPANPDPDPGPAPMPPPGAMPPGGPPGGDPSQGQMPMMAAVHNVAPKCPNCDSHTTEALVSDIEPGNFQCHNCGHAWKRDDVVPTKTGGADPLAELRQEYVEGRISAEEYEAKVGTYLKTQDEGPSFFAPTLMKRTFEHDDLHAHEMAAPAADQVRPDDPARDDNPGGQWATQDGQPLIVGQEYEMYSAKYDVPDVVRIEAVKPDSIEYTLTGEYGLEHRTEVSKQEAEMDGITFLPTDDADTDPEAQMNEQHAPDATMQAPPPGHPMAMQSSVEYDDDLWDDSRYASVHVANNDCPHCGMGPVDPQSHICYTCNRRSDPWGAEPWRGEPSQAPPRRPYAPLAFTAGAKYTPMEQRDFIDESGTARNADKLDLSGTHYEAREQPLSDDLFLFGL